MAELTSITIRLVMRRSSRPRFPISANVCIGCDLLRQYHFGVVLIFSDSLRRNDGPQPLRAPPHSPHPGAELSSTKPITCPSINRFLIIVSSTHASGFVVFSCVCCWLRFRVLSNANLLRLLDRCSRTRRGR